MAKVSGGGGGWGASGRGNFVEKKGEGDDRDAVCAVGPVGGNCLVGVWAEGSGKGGARGPGKRVSRSTAVLLWRGLRGDN